MKEVFMVKKWTKQWNSWYYENTQTQEFNVLLGDGDQYSTYAEAQEVIRKAGPGIYAIDKIFVKK